MFHLGQTDRTMETRCKEHIRHCLVQPKKSAVAVHRFETGYDVDFSRKSILDKATGYMNRMIKEAIETRLHPRTFSMDGGFTLSRSRYTVTNLLKQYRDTSIRRHGQAMQAYDTSG